MLPQAQQNDLPTPFLVAWPAHIFLITLPASPPAILFQFEHSITSQPVQLFHLVHTFFSLNMSKYVLFCFMFHVLHLLARLSGAIQHIFNHLAGAQYTDCITCLASTHFAWVYTNHPNFASLLVFMSLNMPTCVLFPIFFMSFHPSVSPQAQQIDHGPPHKRVSPIVLIYREQP